MGVIGKFIIKGFLGICAVVVTAVAGYGSYLWSTYIDETVVAGSAYGFTIGDDKQTTYSKASAVLTPFPNTVFTLVTVSAETEAVFGGMPGNQLFVQALLFPEGYEAFSEEDIWEFYFEASVWNSIKLTFCDGRLCEIYRHRQYFELL